jgi:GNAT superfamily N-acetyltransferase
LPRWTVTDARPCDVDVIDEFAARVWDDYHHVQGHGQKVNWRSVPIELIARAGDGAALGIATGEVSAGVGHLSELLVAPEAQGAGLGTELLRAFEARCWSAGCHKLTLHTEHDGPAYAFYERRGWQMEAIHRRDKAGLDFVRLVKFREHASIRGK